MQSMACMGYVLSMPPCLGSDAALQLLAALAQHIAGAARDAVYAGMPIDPHVHGTPNMTWASGASGC